MIATAYGLECFRRKPESGRTGTESGLQIRLLLALLSHPGFRFEEC